MKYFSTKDKNYTVSFRTAVMKGLAKDGGLFMPAEIPLLYPLNLPARSADASLPDSRRDRGEPGQSGTDSIISKTENYSLQEIGYEIAKNFVGDEIPEQDLLTIIESAINFPAPLVQLSDQLYVLELFHGPTLAFKDFGARFMAKTMGYFAKGFDKELNILVATSGDTGSAVAHGFYGADGVRVFLLYPEGKVSFIQEQQLTTLDKNITALEIKGTFDDCQRLVKEAFVDKTLNQKLNLSSANSINIARLIPQSFYYVNAYRQIKEKTKPVVVSVPSGNLGNLTAGLFAKKMGLPIEKFIGATNKNNVFTEFLNTAQFKPRKSVLTLSNAMDVGNPSNLERIVELYNGNIEKIRSDVSSFSYSDEATKEGIKEVFEKYNYTLDPHGAVGYKALKDFIELHTIKNVNCVVVETAHPAKFKNVVEETIGKEIEIPERLAACINKEKKTIRLNSDFASLKEFLINA
ncbi:MAG: threonine synthase [Bacteroidota bacterium]